MTCDDCGYLRGPPETHRSFDGAGSRAIPSPPPAAREVFGDRLATVERYVALLAGPGTSRGLIGPREIDRVWDRHILNCSVVAELVPSPCTLVDIGSGAGLPGVVLAILLPHVSVILVESMQKRSAFLCECVAELGLANVEVRRSRAEDLVGEVSADVVTARAVAPLPRLVEWAAGVARPGGTILAIKGDRATDELRQARGVLRGLGVRRAEILAVGQDRVEPGTVVVRIVVGDGKGARFRGSRRDRA
jgi:16S rRNA (guanine527-N7)-methyltransferase